MAQNPVFELEFEETVAGFQIQPVGADAFPTAELNEDAPADAPRVIVRNDQPWSVSFRWRTSGTTAELLVGDWSLEVHLVQVNGGAAPNHFTTNKVVSHVPTNPNDYSEVVEVGPGIVLDGLYKLYTDVNINVPGAAKARITGFGEGPMMEFYTPN